MAQASENLTPTLFNPSKMGQLEQQIFNALAVFFRQAVDQGFNIPVTEVTQAQLTAAIDASTLAANVANINVLLTGFIGH
jgi:hypothetical protein